MPVLTSKIRKNKLVNRYVNEILCKASVELREIKLCLAPECPDVKN